MLWLGWGLFIVHEAAEQRADKNEGESDGKAYRCVLPWLRNEPIQVVLSPQSIDVLHDRELLQADPSCPCLNALQIDRDDLVFSNFLPSSVEGKLLKGLNGALSLILDSLRFLALGQVFSPRKVD